jgi:hypothetical protein
MSKQQGLSEEYRQDSILSVPSRSPTFLLDPLQSPFREMGLILTNHAAKRSPRNAETLSGAAWVSPQILAKECWTA